MCLCNDRRWPETYRVMGLQAVEMVLLGYNTPFTHTGHADIDGLTSFHNHLYASGCLSECDLGRWCSKMRRGGGIQHAGSKRDRRALWRDSRDGIDAR